MPCTSSMMLAAATIAWPKNSSAARGRGARSRSRTSIEMWASRAVATAMPRNTDHAKTHVAISSGQGRPELNT